MASRGWAADRTAPGDDGASRVGLPVPHRHRVRRTRPIHRRERHRRQLRVLLRPLRALRRRAPHQPERARHRRHRHRQVRARQGVPRPGTRRLRATPHGHHPRPERRVRPLRRARTACRSSASTPAAPTGSTRWTTAATRPRPSTAKRSPPRSSPACSAGRSTRPRTPCSAGRSPPSPARGRPFTLADVAATVADPADELVALSRRTPLELAHAATPVVFAARQAPHPDPGRACSTGRPPSPSTGTHGPGFVVDLSAVYGDDEALPLVMLAATSWLAAALQRDSDRARHPSHRRSLGRRPPRRPPLPSHASSSSRTYGVSTWLVCHRPADLTAQADDGTAVAKIAAGLLSDIQTRDHLPPTPRPGRASPPRCSPSPNANAPGSANSSAAGPCGGSQRRGAVVHTVLTAAERRAVRHRRCHDDLTMATTGSPRPRWDIDDVLARTDLAALLDELAEPATHQRARPTLALPVPEPRRPPRLGHHAHRPPRPRTLALLVR